MPKNITTPVGRLVGGSLYDLTDNKDAKGQVKIGRDGLPQKSCWFHIAIPKGPEQSWMQTPWGAEIRAEGFAGHPTFAPHPGFAWKIEDGDDTTPQIKRGGRRNCDNENIRGCWLLKFSSSFLPKIYNKDGSQQILEIGAVKLGYFVQVNFDVACNTGDSPGVYLNPRLVALSAYGEEIYYGPDPSAAGFGAAPLPAGASAVPPSAGFNPVAPAPVGAVAPAPAPVAPAPAPAYPLPTAPAMNFLTPPVPGVAVPPVPPVPAAPVHQMTPAAGGVPYESFIAQNWTDDLLRQHGMML